MSQRIKLIIGIILFFAYGTIALYSGWLPGSAREASAKLQRAVDQQLVNADLDAFITVTIDGQEAMITGLAQTPQERLEIIETVKKAQWSGGILIGGITQVNAKNLQLIQAGALDTPFIWAAEKKRDGSVIISGMVPDRISQRDIVQYAQTLFSGGVIDQMSVARGNVANDWFSAMQISLSSLSTLTAGRISSSDTRFILTGQVTNEADLNKARALFSTLPSHFSREDNISVYRLSPISETSSPNLPMINQVGTCQVLINNLMRDSSVNFRSAKAILITDAYPVLDNIGQLFQRCSQFSIRVEVHTDNVGSSALNQLLSERRAQAIVDYLIVSGVSRSKLSAHGYGENYPIAENTSPHGRAQNRRIEFKVIP